MMESALRWLVTTPIAHRGLHDRDRGVIENSLSAFRAALEAGYGIELDLRLSRDGEAIVFHDETLERLTAQTGAVRHRTAAELAAIPLTGTTDCIPTLSDVLHLVAGRVPLLIEVKAPTRRIGRLEARVAELLRSYEGPFAIQSFNPLVLQWFRAHAPDMLRGLLSTDYRDTGPYRPSWRIRFTMRHLLTAPIVRPHFIAYDVNALPAFAPAIARRLGLPLLAWTVANDQQRKIGATHADNIIFEGFRPAQQRA